MAFNLKAKTIIESATLELDAGQLVVLADAAVHLQAVCEAFDGDVDQSAKDPRPLEVVALDPVMELLSSIARLVDQAGAVGMAQKKTWSRKPKNPTSGS